jgi:ubiquinone/menaquinone biosynthesis C-methylase UbiE
MSNAYEETVTKHYEQVAEQHGLSETSTMEDTTTRRKEIEAIATVLDKLVQQPSYLLEIGCGNGVLLDVLRTRYPDLKLAGRDFSQPMVELAESRGIANCDVARGDVRSLDFEDETFDFVVGERVVINLMDREHQWEALAEIARVLRPGGYYLCIEAFKDGLNCLNEARAELGLEPNAEAYHNLWFQEAGFRQESAKHFEVIDTQSFAGVPQHFLSSYYFISRVVYPAVTRTDLKYNTHFVRFFADQPPRGTYAPIQLFLLRKRTNPQIVE